MLSEELRQLVEDIQSKHAEAQTVEIKSARGGCPSKLYDTLSSFSNQDDGGIIVFGLEESSGFSVVGVYDLQDLQKHVAEQCNQMTPKVRPVFTTAEIDGKYVLSAEIPSIDIADRPCFYSGKGRLKGSFVRVGESDEPMTEYEIYSYEAYRKEYQDEIRPVSRATMQSLDESKVAQYLLRLKTSKQNMAHLEDNLVLELMSITREGELTLAGIMLLSLYPQAFFPQLCIVATVMPSEEAGAVGEQGERFLDNKRIEGTLDDQLDGALAFVRTNTRTSTSIDPHTGKRTDRTDYPLEAVRELLLNALIHRDYSVHTQGMPIQLQVFPNRLTITNPGGIYGRLTVDELGKMQPGTRNPVIATAMETLGLTENRYSGIPTVRRLMNEAGLPAPVFEDYRGEFRATLRRTAEISAILSDLGRARLSDAEKSLIKFCSFRPRTRAEIAEHLGVQAPYAMRRYVKPLLEKGILKTTIPETPNSPRQQYVLRR